VYKSKKKCTSAWPFDNLPEGGEMENFSKDNLLAEKIIWRSTELSPACAKPLNGARHLSLSLQKVFSVKTNSLSHTEIIKKSGQASKTRPTAFLFYRTI